MNWWRAIPDDASGKWWATCLQRSVDPKQWVTALERVPADRREDTAEYLRDIYRRMRAQRQVRKAAA